MSRNDALNDHVAKRQWEAKQRGHEIAGTGWISAVEAVAQGKNVLMVVPTRGDRHMLVAAKQGPLEDRKIKIARRRTTFNRIVLSNGTNIEIVSAAKGEAALLGVSRETVLVFVYR